MQCEFPKFNSNSKEIKEIFIETKTIAIIGLSPNEKKDSNIVAKYLKNVGFKIIPIYPKEDYILNEKVYRNLNDVPCKIDMVDIFRKPSAINDIINTAISRGDVKTIWTQIGIVNNEACKIALDAGLKVIQNKCSKVEHYLSVNNEQ